MSVTFPGCARLAKAAVNLQRTRACTPDALRKTPLGTRILPAAATAAGAAVVAAACRPLAGRQAGSSLLLQRAHCSAALPSTACSACNSDSGSNHASSSSPVEQPDQYALLRIAGDGRCLFRSLTQGSHIAAQEDTAIATAAAAGANASAAGHASQPQQQAQQQGQVQLLASQQETELADQLRADVCRQLLERREELWFFIDEDYDNYVRRMQAPHTWGGEPELAVAIHVLQRPIAVYMQERGGLRLVSRYGEEQYSGRAEVPLYFHGAGHYDLLVRYTLLAAPVPQQQQQPRSRL